jgi:hypothetical protein
MQTGFRRRWGCPCKFTRTSLLNLQSHLIIVEILYAGKDNIRIVSNAFAPNRGSVDSRVDFLGRLFDDKTARHPASSWGAARRRSSDGQARNQGANFAII